MPSSHTAPPKSLETDLELSPSDWADQDVYFLMTGLVIPRPIAWVSTLSADGVDNLAPYSFFNAMGHKPPVVVFSSGGMKDSVTNIQNTGEFVVNLVSQHQLEKMNYTSTDFPEQISEFSRAQLRASESKTVAPKRVAEAKAHFECKLVEIVTVGLARIVIGEVKHIHVDPQIWHQGRIDPRRYDPVCRLSGSWYANLGDLIHLKRPMWDNVQHTTGLEGMPTISEDD